MNGPLSTIFLLHITKRSFARFIFFLYFFAFYIIGNDRCGVVLLNSLSYTFLSNINKVPFTTFVNSYQYIHILIMYFITFLVKHLFSIPDGAHLDNLRRLQWQNSEINNSLTMLLATTHCKARIAFLSNFIILVTLRI